MKFIKCFLQLLILLIICNNVFAQVPVIKEPHHKPVLVNDYVRLLDVHINAGDTTLYHVHAAPSVGVMISNSTIGIQKSGEAPSTPGNVTAGSTSFVDYEKNPVTHRVYNAGNNVFHVMDIELVKKQSSPDSCAVLEGNNIQTTINEKLVRVYKFNFVANKALNIIKNSCAHLLICISGEITTIRKKIEAGDFLFFNPNTEITLGNTQTENAICVLIELK